MPGGQANETEYRTPPGSPLEREIMDAREAADYLRLPYDQFKRLARSLPRHAVTERRFVYVRSEILEWVLSQPGRGKEPWE